ncbi:Uncharacterized protein SCF082_LOCUS48035 [Durusdinium trenchii]|uniref:Uncharacterized protein n=1 Tax=Durusdinium trenchii TaxID=1381693 RepID=A0ABP0RQ68_9DINO
MARCARTIGESLGRRRAWADITSDEDEEPAAIFTFQRPVPPSVKAEETDSNSSYEESAPKQVDGLEAASTPTTPTTITPPAPVTDAVDAETTTETAGLNAAEPAETGESAETEAPREVRAKAIEEAMKMARLLRKFSEEHWEPEVHEVVVETNIRSEDVERLKGLRESLVARRRASEIQGQLPAREAELEVNRARVAKLRQELVDARKTRELRQQQEAEELRALEREAEAIQEASEKAAELGTVRTDGVQERLKVELQRLQAENQELLRAAQQVRSEDRGSKKEVSVLQAEVNKLKATLAAYRDGTCEMESQLESASKTKAAKMQKLRDLKAKKAELEEEHRTLEAQLKADKKRAQELEAEKVSLQHAVKEAEEAVQVWSWRLKNQIQKIEQREPNSTFVSRLMESAAGQAALRKSRRDELALLNLGKAAQRRRASRATYPSF